MAAIYEHLDEVRDRNLELRAQAYATFNTPQGKEFLEYLETFTRDRSSLYQNHMFDGNVNLRSSDVAFIREGQNQVIRHIKQLIGLHTEV